MKHSYRQHQGCVVVDLDGRLWFILHLVSNKWLHYYPQQQRLFSGFLNSNWREVYLVVCCTLVFSILQLQVRHFVIENSLIAASWFSLSKFVTGTRTILIFPFILKGIHQQWLVIVKSFILFIQYYASVWMIDRKNNMVLYVDLRFSKEKTVPIPNSSLYSWSKHYIVSNNITW